VAPLGKPLMTQLGADAVPGPALRHTPRTVTGCPPTTVPGSVVVARMSALSHSCTESAARLFSITGSGVADWVRANT
jgi:hypothetical protein